MATIGNAEGHEDFIAYVCTKFGLDPSRITELHIHLTPQGISFTVEMIPSHESGGSIAHRHVPLVGEPGPESWHPTAASSKRY